MLGCKCYDVSADVKVLKGKSVSANVLILKYKWWCLSAKMLMMLCKCWGVSAEMKVQCVSAKAFN